MARKTKKELTLEETLFHHLLSLIHDRSYRFDQELFQ